jgi:hypothetical protein
MIVEMKPPILFQLPTYWIILKPLSGPELDYLCLYTYVQTVMMAKKALLGLRPEATILVDRLEQYYRETTQSLFAQLDDRKFYQNKPRAAVILAFQHFSIPYLRVLDTVDLSAVKHIQSAVISHLGFLNDVILTPNFDWDEVFKFSTDPLTALLNSILRPLYS